MSATILPRVVHTAWDRLSNPFDMCVIVVAAVPLLSAVAACAVAWQPLAYVAAAASVPLYPTVHRGVRRALGLGDSSGVSGFVAAAIALLLSIPVTAIYFHGDLTAMSAPAIAAAAAHSETAATVPEAIYGSGANWPSYAICQTMQQRTNVDVAGFCYAGVGYLQMWQMRVALPMLASITLLYIAIPLVVMSFTPRGRTRGGRTCDLAETDGSL